MNLREALIVQSPSLALQRAAADEIARLDRRVAEMDTMLKEAASLLTEWRELAQLRLSVSCSPSPAGSANQAPA